MRATKDSNDGQKAEQPERRASAWVTLAIAAAIASVAVIGPSAQGRGSEPGRGKGRAHVDRELTDRMKRRGDSDRERVIVTAKPGRLGRLLEQLKGQGVTLSNDLSLIEGVAGDLPVGLLRKLVDDPDVGGLSTDATVRAMGVASGISGTALNTPYTLRATLGLDTGGTTRTFQQGANGYYAAVDGNVDSLAPTANRAGLSYAWTDVGPTDAAGMLLRFENLFGNGANQIPAGSTITSVSLRVGHYVDGSSSATASLHQMLTPWSASASWNSMTVSGAGIQFDNLEAQASADASVTGLSSSGARTFSSAELTATVQAWANGQPNNGWVLWQDNTNGWRVRTSEDYTLSNRPLLTVEYLPAGATNLTGAGVTVAVVDSGMLLDGGDPGRIKTTRDFTSGNLNPAAVGPVDGYGHGTHVAGLIGSNQPDIKGVAPGVSYVSLRVLDSLGSGLTSNVIAALQWAVANKTSYGIDVINLSLGHPIFEPADSDPLVQAVEAAARAGIVVVVSAGNYGVNSVTGAVGYAGVSSPGNAPSAITVGAVRTFDTTSRADDLIGDYSSRGPTWFDAYAKPDVVAPGHALVSAASHSQTLYLTSIRSRGRRSVAGRT